MRKSKIKQFCVIMSGDDCVFWSFIILITPLLLSSKIIHIVVPYTKTRLCQYSPKMDIFFPIPPFFLKFFPPYLAKIFPPVFQVTTAVWWLSSIYIVLSDSILSKAICRQFLLLQFPMLMLFYSNILCPLYHTISFL